MSWREITAHFVYWPLRIAYLTLCVLFMAAVAAGLVTVVVRGVLLLWHNYTLVSSYAMSLLIIYSGCARAYRWAESVLNEHER